MLIKARQQLGAWFDEDDIAGFNDAVLYTCTEPNPGDTPEVVVLEVGLPIGFDPAGEEIYYVYRLTARGVSSYSIGGSHSPDHASEGADLLDDGLGFSMDTPGLLRIAFRELDVERLADRHVRYD